MKRISILFVSIFSFYCWSAHAADLPIFLVDKAKFQLHVATYDHGLKILKSYPVTLGKNSGDKMVEGDQKTPEGIYHFTMKYVAPAIKKKFGAMAFYVNYPNAFDRRSGKTGYDIMLHSTDDPSRLVRTQDSDGCMVVDDVRIKELSSYIHTPMTMLLVFDEMKPEYLQTETSGDLKMAFDNWIKAWTTKDIDGFIASYSKDFHDAKMNRDQYRIYKNSLNKKYETIDVKVTDAQFYHHPKYDLVTFTQEYSSTFPGGRKAFTAHGRKQIYFVREDGVPKILTEEITH